MDQRGGWAATLALLIAAIVGASYLPRKAVDAIKPPEAQSSPAKAGAPLDLTSGQAMMAKDGCAACHAIDKKIVGPAYQDVAAKYKGDAGALAKLTQKVKAGGVGVWGTVPMPPNSFVADDDIKSLVTWILTLKK